MLYTIRDSQLNVFSLQSWQCEGDWMRIGGPLPGTGLPLVEWTALPRVVALREEIE